MARLIFDPHYGRTPELNVAGPRIAMIPRPVEKKKTTLETMDEVAKIASHPLVNLGLQGAWRLGQEVHNAGLENEYAKQQELRRQEAFRGTPMLPGAGPSPSGALAPDDFRRAVIEDPSRVTRLSSGGFLDKRTGNVYDDQGRHVGRVSARPSAAGRPTQPLAQATAPAAPQTTGPAAVPQVALPPLPGGQAAEGRAQDRRLDAAVGNIVGGGHATASLAPPTGLLSPGQLDAGLAELGPAVNMAGPAPAAPAPAKRKTRGTGAISKASVLPPAAVAEAKRRGINLDASGEPLAAPEPPRPTVGYGPGDRSVPGYPVDATHGTDAGGRTGQLEDILPWVTPEFQKEAKKLGIDINRLGQMIPAGGAGPGGGVDMMGRAMQGDSTAVTLQDQVREQQLNAILGRDKARARADEAFLSRPITSPDLAIAMAKSADTQEKKAHVLSSVRRFHIPNDIFDAMSGLSLRKKEAYFASMMPGNRRHDPIEDMRKMALSDLRVSKANLGIQDLARKLGMYGRELTAKDMENFIQILKAKGMITEQSMAPLKAEIMRARAKRLRMKPAPRVLVYPPGTPNKPTKIPAWKLTRAGKFLDEAMRKEGQIEKWKAQDPLLASDAEATEGNYDRLKTVKGEIGRIFGEVKDYGPKGTAALRKAARLLSDELSLGDLAAQANAAANAREVLPELRALQLKVTPHMSQPAEMFPKLSERLNLTGMIEYSQVKDILSKGKKIAEEAQAAGIYNKALAEVTKRLRGAKKAKRKAGVKLTQNDMRQAMAVRAHDLMTVRGKDMERVANQYAAIDDWLRTMRKTRQLTAPAQLAVLTWMSDQLGDFDMIDKADIFDELNKITGLNVPKMYRPKKEEPAEKPERGDAAAEKAK